MKALPMLVYFFLLQLCISPGTIQARHHNSSDYSESQEEADKRFQHWFNKTMEKLESRSQIAMTSHGPIEYVKKGSGPVVLILHGGLGGYDQGFVIGSPLIKEGFTILAPSRPGYLRTPLSVGPLHEEQADAMISLLDTLGISQVSVLGFSDGAHVALELALRYPHRILGIALNSISTSLDESFFSSLFLENLKLANGHEIDFGSWILDQNLEHHPWSTTKQILSLDNNLSSKTFKKRIGYIYRHARSFTSLIKFIHATLPVSPRALGFANDIHNSINWDRFPYAFVKTPTLIVAAINDTSSNYTNAAWIANQIPTAQLTSVTNSGHLSLFCQSGPTIQEQLTRFFNLVSPTPATNLSAVLQQSFSLSNWNTLSFPVGLVLSQGQPGNISDYSPSEAWGYAIRNAVEYDQPTFFSAVVTSYLYFANQTQFINKTLNAGLPPLWGLMGWSPNIIQGNYPINSQFFTSASDADEDIIRGLIEGYMKFGELTFQDTKTPPGSNIYNSLTLSQMALYAGQSFANPNPNAQNNQSDIGIPNSGPYQLPSTPNNYMLTNDIWGHDPVNPDYYDPILFQELVTFFTNQVSGQYTPYINTLNTASTNTMTAIQTLANSFGGWIPNTAYDQGNSGTFGYDAVRILMRLGEYISTPGVDSDMQEQAISVLQKLIAKILPLSQPFPNLNGWPGNSYQFPPSGLVGGAFTGPLYLAILSLQKQNALQPTSITPAQLTAIQAAFNSDLSNFSNISNFNSSNWATQGYFSAQLILLCNAIIERLDLD